MIARVDDHDFLETVRALGIPVVNALNSCLSDRLPTVVPNEAQVAGVAFEHLYSRGFRSFAFVGRAGAAWSASRRDAFACIVAERRCALTTRDVDPPRPYSARWEHWTRDLGQWLASLPTGTGLMLASDFLGPPIALACREASVTIPDHVALVGVDDDWTFCDGCAPPLSSVCARHDEVGYETARLLDHLMRGNPAPTHPIEIDPGAVVTRQSTDVMAVNDDIVTRAMTIIRHQACTGLTVDDLVRRLPVSRSVLQRRFRAAIGRSVHEEIARTRLHRAETLLADTELPLGEVAEQAGFRHAQYMWTVFRRALDITPLAYRVRHRRPRAPRLEDPTS